MIPGANNMTNNGIIEKYCYDNNEANCDIYGGLYQWNEMMQYVTTEGVQGICLQAGIYLTMGNGQHLLIFWEVKVLPEVK